MDTPSGSTTGTRGTKVTIDEHSLNMEILLYELE